MNERADPFAHRSALPTLESERFVLRAITPDDAPALFEIFSDPEVTRYWSHPPLCDLSGAEEFVRQTVEGFRRRDLLEWGVVERGQDRLIGTCAFAGWTPMHRRAELGFALQRDQWGRGIMTEVLPVLLRFGFGEMKLHRVEADVDPRNAASIRRLEQLGFRREGYLRERYFLNEEVQDAIVYGLLRSEATFLEEALRAESGELKG